MAPWEGPRHKSWASNTVISGIALAFLLICTLVSDYFAEPPTYLVGLLGTAAGAFFGAVGSDKAKKEAEVSRTAKRAEAKADAVERRVTDSNIRADAAEERESGWSQHRDHLDGDDDHEPNRGTS